MRKIDNNTGKYYLPAEFRASMPISTHILHLSLAIIFTLIVIFLPDYSNPTYKDIFFIISGSLFVVFCIINWLYWGILRKGKIEIDNYAIHINTLYVKKVFVGKTSVLLVLPKHIQNLCKLFYINTILMNQKWINLTSNYLEVPNQFIISL